MPSIDKTLIAARFGVRAGTYDAATPIQDRMSRTLLAGIDAHFRECAPERILELGCGTGRLTAQIVARFPHAHVDAIDISEAMAAAAQARCPTANVAVADAEAHVHTMQAHYDLVVSSATAQWFERPGETLGRARDLLRVSGLLGVATFGERTLHELRESFAAAYSATGHAAGNHLVDLVSLAALRQCFPDAEVAEETIEQQFRDVRALLRSLQDAGAVNSARDRQPLPRVVLHEMYRHYESRFATAAPPGIRATYHVGYLYIGRDTQRDVA